MSDYLYSGRLKVPDLAFSYAVTTSLVNEAILRHDCGPVSGHILSRALTAGLLSGSLLGEDERLNIRWQYEGNLKTLLVDAAADGSVRGFVSPTDLFSYEGDVEDLFGGSGKVTVIRSRGGQVLNSGAIEAQLMNVVEDLSFFMCTSDQVETALSIMIALSRDITQPVRMCQGLLIQALPGCDLDAFDRVRRSLAEDEGRFLMSQETSADTHFETVINSITAAVTQEPGVSIGRSLNPRFECNCSRDKMGAVLRTLGREERESIVSEGRHIAIHCRFCNERYELSVDECRALWQG